MIETLFGCTYCGLIYNGDDPKDSEVVWLRTGCADCLTKEITEHATAFAARVKGTVWEAKSIA